MAPAIVPAAGRGSSLRNMCGLWAEGYGTFLNFVLLRLLDGVTFAPWLSRR
jgi:hypothetical protein